MQTVNIPNAYEDDRFDPKVDEDMGFKHKTILCMPIKNSSGQIIGVIQVSLLLPNNYIYTYVLVMHFISIGCTFNYLRFTFTSFSW